MPVDQEKSTKQWKVYKKVCTCGSESSTPIVHLEGTAPTQEALEDFNKRTKEPS